MGVFELAWRPPGLAYEEFRALDVECFPDQPLGGAEFEERVASEFWTARSGSRLVGYAYVKLTDELAWLARIGVAASERRRGIGRALMEAVVARSRELERPEVILYVEQDNAPAVRLYEEFGFGVVEDSWQYIVPVERIPAAGSIGTRPLTDLPPERRPALSAQWSNLPEIHDPPGTHVLVFEEEGEVVGYCRLTPGFPGCFPFVLDSADARIEPALAALRPLLSSEFDYLKLTVWDEEIVRTCERLGYRRNYRLFRMSLAL